jgi:putative transposase
MKKPWSFDESDSLYFCTDVIVGWQYVFASAEFFETIIDSLEYCQENKGLRLHAYVIMPNHVHSIISASQGNLSSIIRDYKRYTSGRISDLLGEAKNKRLLNYFRSVARREERENEYKYIHNNPVVKGYVERPEHWKFSSARNYILNDHSIIKVELLE